MNTPHVAHIAVAVGEELVRAEALHAAAATSAEVIQVEDPRDVARLVQGARAVLVDAAMASLVATLPVRPTVFFVGADPGPLDYEAALRCHADEAFLLPAEAKELLAALGDLHRRDGQQHGGLNIAVTGAGGGVGASTLAAALARHTGALLIDAVPNSGGLDLLLGLEAQPGARWPDLNVGDGSIDPADLRTALPSSADGVAVLSAARSTVTGTAEVDPATVHTFIDAVRPFAGVRIVDCPRESIPPACDHVVVVVAAEVRSAAIATQLLADLRAHKIPASVVLRHRQWSGLSVEEVEKIVHAPVIAQLPNIRGLTRACELGGLPQQLPRALKKVAATVATEAGWRA
ncbi:Helicase/secretion neighborhood CpaE-like protein [Corynebacterium camporealensis]|uniref:Helicase/secretion neighborhood CpaE-like protein n=1 Tax=Corynebacterium camporealensis TaxID=161896 RepID=A0A0F6QV66_9CORY|nr:septum site-determining protein Ssd [Corynebacterium camporealensis]AKE38185.1 helicase/secretion neighborhood CpaE-like protein [Corynebacterium camporealensis]AVH87502.1 Helicase/secretion neighborhood CpaE-like protein [Corynebacterium camporealensis]